MKQDDEQKNDYTQNEPEHYLDAEILDKEDAAQKSDDEPIAVIDTSKYKSGLSIEEWSKLKKQDPSTLTPAQKRAVETADEQAKKAAQALSSHLSEITNVGKTASDVLKKFSVGSAFKNIPFPTIPQIEPLHASVLDTPNFDFDIVPPPSAAQQRKQTLLLERMVEAIESQQADQFTELKNAVTPFYDAENKQLIFCNRIIDVTKGKDYERFCKVMFRNGVPRKTPIQFGDLLERLNHDSDTTKVRNLVNNFNNYIAKHTQVTDFFYAKKKEVYFNSKYV